VADASTAVAVTTVTPSTAKASIAPTLQAVVARAAGASAIPQPSASGQARAHVILDFGVIDVLPVVACERFRRFDLRVG